MCIKQSIMAIIAVIKRENGMTNKLNKMECSIIALKCNVAHRCFWPAGDIKC